MSKSVNPLTLQDVQYIAHKLAKKHMDWNEPIPSFSERFPGILESCLKQPFLRVQGK